MSEDFAAKAALLRHATTGAKVNLQVVPNEQYPNKLKPFSSGNT
jgi:hypothetical protein